MQLDLVEEDYFGLQFMDKNQVPHWLDKTKKIKKQIQGMLFRTSIVRVFGLDHHRRFFSKQKIGPPTFHFRVKFYTSEPINLGEELTRYQFFLQLKQDILQGKMPCPGEKAIKVRFSTTLITSPKITLFSWLLLRCSLNLGHMKPTFTIFISFLNFVSFQIKMKILKLLF